MIGEPPVCMRFKHYLRSSGARCEAFPSGIPDEIWYHHDPHTAPFPGDNGILFEPIDRPSRPASRRRTDRSPRRAH
jgi:hypothetical protein